MPRKQLINDREVRQDGRLYIHTEDGGMLTVLPGCMGNRVCVKCGRVWRPRDTDENGT